MNETIMFQLKDFTPCQLTVDSLMKIDDNRDELLYLCSAIIIRALLNYNSPQRLKHIDLDSFYRYIYGCRKLSFEVFRGLASVMLCNLRIEL